MMKWEMQSRERTHFMQLQLTQELHTGIESPILSGYAQGKLGIIVRLPKAVFCILQVLQ